MTDEPGENEALLEPRSRRRGRPPSPSSGSDTANACGRWSGFGSIAGFRAGSTLPTSSRRRTSTWRNGCPSMSRDRAFTPYLWLRLVTGQRLVEVHRRHLGTAMRDAGREVSLYRGALPQASSVSLAAQLLGRFTTASQAAVRAERQLQLQAVLNGMDPMDREILALRHFEELSNGEAAEVLGLSKTAANNRYIRALGRLRDLLESMPGFLDKA